MPPPVHLSPESRRALATGAGAFDAARFFEAHEVWEDAWRVQTGTARQLLHGLIQVAAAFHKGLSQGNPRGMVRLLERGLARLDGLGEAAGIDRFRREVGAWLDPARAWAAGGSRPTLPLPRLASSRLARADASGARTPPRP